MTIYERETQSESWWKARNCPLMCDGAYKHKCEGDRCALWRQTGELDGEKSGICTKAQKRGSNFND